MSATTAIQWCDSTFNPWIGCTKVSPGCANCYAERDFDLRKHVAKWGAGQPRHRTSEAYWKQPLRWNTMQACSNCGHLAGGSPAWCPECGPSRDWAGRRPRVFCGSLCDWLDDEVPIEWLADLLYLIRRTPNLDWLLLTKRPENFLPRLQQIANERDPHWSPSTRFPRISSFAAAWIGQFGDGPMIPANVWIGTTVEDQARADERIPALLKMPARVRFLSCEPLLGPVNLRLPDHDFSATGTELIHWVICGGESGPKARPMNPEWAMSMRGQCRLAGVPFLFKQWGEHNEQGQRVGKHAAGRLLDGREHNEFPEVRS